MRVIAPKLNTGGRGYRSQDGKPQLPVLSEENGQIALPDDNRVELNINESRVNVNNNWDDNHNDNLWLSAARQFFSLFLLLPPF